QEINPSEDGKIVLKMSKVYGIIGTLSVVISLIITILAFSRGSFLGDDVIYAVGMIAFFFLLGLLLVLYTRNTMVEATSDKIVYVGLTGKRKEIAWNQVEAISFNTSSKEIILKSKTTRIKLHIHLKGIGSLIKIIKQNVGLSIYEQT
ncbi:hypothetical protein, partial [Clostridium perfringens]|uniref:hypothetical protein n=2 Tax=Clostridium TaxID=1485 RepID=UPI002ACC072A